MSALASTEFMVLTAVRRHHADEMWAVSRQATFISDSSEWNRNIEQPQRVRPGDLLATLSWTQVNACRRRKAINCIAGRSTEARLESRTLSGLRDTLLPKLMSGEIRVREAERIVEDAT